MRWPWSKKPKPKKEEYWGVETDAMIATAIGLNRVKVLNGAEGMVTLFGVAWQLCKDKQGRCIAVTEAGNIPVSDHAYTYLAIHLRTAQQERVH